MLNAAPTSLATLLTRWWELLQDWAVSGRFSSAVVEALALSGEPELLQRLQAQLALGEVSTLPPVELLPSDGGTTPPPCASGVATLPGSGGESLGTDPNPWNKSMNCPPVAQ